MACIRVPIDEISEAWYTYIIDVEEERVLEILGRLCISHPKQSILDDFDWLAKLSYSGCFLRRAAALLDWGRELCRLGRRVGINFPQRLGEVAVVHVGVLLVEIFGRRR